MRHALAAGAALLLAAAPGFANEPVKLTNQELDQVSAGEGLVDLNAQIDVLLRDLNVTVNVDNVPVNAGMAVQANVLGDAIQGAEVSAIQQVQQYAFR